MQELSLQVMQKAYHHVIVVVINTKNCIIEQIKIMQNGGDNFEHVGDYDYDDFFC